MNVELERFDPAEQNGRIVYEHLHRYAFCREFVTGRRVLDLACGTGYGTAILGTSAAEVTGVDISAAAIRTARKRYARENVRFAIGDCFDLPFENGSFDVVVANEMIEHVEDHAALIAEIRRVLADKGLLLVSTPNKPVYNRYKTPNVFHVAEMEVPEFRKLLTDRFKYVQMTGTRMALLSVAYALDLEEGCASGNLNAARIHLATGESAGEPKIEMGELQLSDPEYVLAICSDAPLERPPLSSSIFFDERQDLWLEHEKIMAWASNLHEEDEVLRDDVARTREQLEDARLRAAQLEAERADIAFRLEQLSTAQANLGSALEGERKALARETEAVRQDAMARLSTFAELLGRMCQQPVAADDGAILCSLFQINEALVTERLQRAQAEARSEELTSDRVRLASELAARADELASERRAREELETARAALSEEAQRLAEQLSAAQADAAAEVDRLAAELAAQAQDLAAERRLRAETEAAHAASASALQQENARLASLIEQLEALKELSFTAAGELEAAERSELPADPSNQHGQEGADSIRAVFTSALREAKVGTVAEKSENRAELALNALHRRTAAMLASAPAQVAGRIAPPPEPTPLPWHRKVLGKGRVLDTRIFSSAWLARQDQRLADLSLRAFLADPRHIGLSPHPLFDAEYYLRSHPDVAESGMSPLVHYVLHGWREGRDPHPLFANDWYLAQNPDVAAHGAISTLDHYLLHGWNEGRRPNPLFNPRTYLDRYPDVAAAEFEPLTHFMLYGEAEGRELAIDGWGPELPDIALQGGPLKLMERLLRETPRAPVAPAMSTPANSPEPAPWPPAPVDNFWPAQIMREMVSETYGEPLLGRIWYLLSLMNRWQDRQSEFVNSDDCRTLLERLRQRAAIGVEDGDGMPDATVIIPVYNNVLDTLLCLASVLELEERHSFDVIVADDGSTDATAALITTIGEKVRYVRQPRNLGFLGNCNAAAALAQGKTIILLNNDTLVFSGWLDGLLDPIATLSGVGLVGSKLINWDGTLQEAGGIFWRDGSAWNFGRNQDARAPGFNYLKDVDYCSGASIAVPASIWREVGGFDQTYSPAYCEDSDLAFRLREAGYRTLYSPLSEVVHHEGRSHGRDVTSGIKAYQVRNQERLLERWRPVLEREHFPNAENVLRARDRSSARHHVLVIDHYVPQPDRDAGSRTMFDFLQVLVQAGHAVTFWPDNLWRDPDYTAGLQKLGIEVIYGPRYHQGFEQFLADRRGLYDMILLSRPHIAVKYIDAARRLSNAGIVYYGHDLHFRRMMAERELAGQPVEDGDVRAMKAQELGICAASDLVLYPSEEEAKQIAELMGAGVNAQAIAAYRYREHEIVEARQSILTKPSNGDVLHLLFVGGFGHPPNVDAALWFCHSVMPLVRAERKVHLTIVGSRPPAEVLTLQQADVSVLGFVSDDRLRALYREADIAVAPLRYGAGVKGKVVEAMARGLPVVTTRIGAQGIESADDLMFIGDTAEALANAILSAADPGAARERALAAVDFIERRYSTQTMTSVLEIGLTMRGDQG